MESQENCLATEQASGTAEQAITQEMLPPQGPRSKLKKLLGRLRKSITSLPAETGRVALEREREEGERGSEREIEPVTEKSGLGIDAVVVRAPAPQTAPVSLSRDATTVGGRPPTMATVTRRDIESSEVFWDRVEYIDPQEYKRRQTEKHAPIIGQLESTTAPFRDEPVQRRSLDGVDRRPTNPPLCPLRLTTSLAVQPIYQHPGPTQISDGGYFISTPGCPELHLPLNSESGFEAVKQAIPAGPTIDYRPEANIAEPEEDTGNRAVRRAIPLYDHPEHPIDVTIMGTISQEEERMRTRTEEDMYSGKFPGSKRKDVRIEGPEPEQRGRAE